jgi:hypothetical protein
LTKDNEKEDCERRLAVLFNNMVSLLIVDEKKNESATLLCFFDDAFKAPTASLFALFVSV